MSRTIIPDNEERVLKNVARDVNYSFKNVEREDIEQHLREYTMTEAGYAQRLKARNQSSPGLLYTDLKPRAIAYCMWWSGMTTRDPENIIENHNLQYSKKHIENALPYAFDTNLSDSEGLIIEVKRGISVLDDEQKLLLAYRFYKEYSYKEMSLIYGYDPTPVNADKMRKRTMRAFNQLYYKVNGGGPTRIKKAS